MNEIIVKYKKIFSKPKTLIIIGVMGILLILLSSVMPTKKENTKLEQGEFSYDEYKAELQKNVEKIVKSITGDRRASVLITFENSVLYSYANVAEETTKESDNNSDSELKTGYITVKNADGSEKTVLVTAKMPSVRGVAIVCEGGDNELINQKLTGAVTAALNITSKRVYICGRKN